MNWRAFLLFFFFNDTATTEIYTLSLHDALPISGEPFQVVALFSRAAGGAGELEPVRRIFCLANGDSKFLGTLRQRSEEHTSELQSRQYLVCRLLLEKKKKKYTRCHIRPKIHINH